MRRKGPIRKTSPSKEIKPFEGIAPEPNVRSINPSAPTVDENLPAYDKLHILIKFMNLYPPHSSVNLPECLLQSNRRL